MEFRKKPFAFLFCFLSAGIVIGYGTRWSITGVLGAYAFFIILSLALSYRYPRVSFLFLAVSFVALGMLLFQARGPMPRKARRNDLRSYYYRTATVQGVIVSHVQKRKFLRSDKYVFILDVWRVKQDGVWRERREKVLASAFGPRDLFYGDVIEASGKLYPPFNFSKDTFSYKDHLARKGIHTLLSVKAKAPVVILARRKGGRVMQAAMWVKERCKDVFVRYLTANESAIAQAILLGDRYLVPKELKALFVSTGTMHILVISGMHIGVMAFLILFLFQALSIKRSVRIVLTILSLSFYALLTGAQPPVLRATLMACVFLCGMLLERQEDHVNSLALAGVVLLLVNPWNLFDAGFQLSFMSVFSILCFYPPTYRLARHVLRLKVLTRWADFFLQSLIVSLVVWISIAGIIAYYFRLVTPVTVIANVLLVPLLAPMMISCAGLVISGIAAPVIAPAFAALTKITFNTMVAIVLWLSKVPFGSMRLPVFCLWQAIGYSVAGILFFILIGRLAKRLT